ncbi:barstar family protein [Kitasatospora aburaviensis]
MSVTRPEPPVYVLDGSGITDRAAFYTALGSALNGPGGYYGSNLDALADCLHGGFGPAPRSRWSGRTPGRPGAT